ncbi:DUF4355 domain-containing protein [Acidipropionibacterium timonense]|uniref:DUF4355 domain-containing protein n=1 Tax=Acidipropionibacterium timonense TaxID=2161818 RepID=UPI00102F8A15|nr:DUF4355 domain-containing protein [Acidipropionibacterium timonense]
MPEDQESAKADQGTIENPAREAGNKTHSESATDRKAGARKWESRAKENKAALDRLEQANDSSTSDIDKLTKANGELKAKVDALILEHLRRDVVSAKGLPQEAAAYLSGNDRESLEKSADGLAALMEPRQSQQMRRLAGQPPTDNQERTEELDFIDALVDINRR